MAAAAGGRGPLEVRPHSCLVIRAERQSAGCTFVRLAWHSASRAPWRLLREGEGLLRCVRIAAWLSALSGNLQVALSCAWLATRLVGLHGGCCGRARAS